MFKEKDRSKLTKYLQWRQNKDVQMDSVNKRYVAQKKTSQALKVDKNKKITKTKQQSVTKESAIKKKQRQQKEQSLIADVNSMLQSLHNNEPIHDEEDDFDLDPEYKGSGEQNFQDQRSSQLATKARKTLAGSLFRSLNEYLYSNTSFDARSSFTQNKFQMYHQAYEKIMKEWPLKPIDYLVDVLKVSSTYK